MHRHSHDFLCGGVGVHYLSSSKVDLLVVVLNIQANLLNQPLPPSNPPWLSKNFTKKN